MRQDLSTTYEDSIGSIFQPWETGYDIRAPREQNAINIFCLSHRKISLCAFSLCAKWVKSCPNSVNICTTWKNLRSFLSILDRMQWAKKPSHATVPLNPSVNGKSVWSIAHNGLLLKTQCGQLPKTLVSQKLNVINCFKQFVEGNSMWCAAINGWLKVPKCEILMSWILMIFLSWSLYR